MNKVGEKDGYLIFFCPGCKINHRITVNGRQNSNTCSWNWNGSLESPTITPSINVNFDDDASRCHSVITDGKIYFAPDTYHALKNQTVELPEWKDGTQYDWPQE